MRMWVLSGFMARVCTGYLVKENRSNIAQSAAQLRLLAR
jgi:hypothetical protein